MDNQNPLDAMMRLRDDIQRRLEGLEDFRAWRALDSVIQSVAAPEGATPIARRKAKMNQAQAAEEALIIARKPLTTPQMLDAMADLGVVVGGRAPAMNLASVLSRHERIHSVRRRGARAWWFKDDPEEIAAKLGGHFSGH